MGSPLFLDKAAPRVLGNAAGDAVPSLGPGAWSTWWDKLGEVLHLWQPQRVPRRREGNEIHNLPTWGLRGNRTASVWKGSGYRAPERPQTQRGSCLDSGLGLWARALTGYSSTCCQVPPRPGPPSVMAAPWGAGCLGVNLSRSLGAWCLGTIHRPGHGGQRTPEQTGQVGAPCMTI